MLRALDVGVSSGGSPSFTDLTLTGDLTFGGTNQRILADWSLDPTSPYFQNTNTFGDTIIGILPGSVAGQSARLAVLSSATTATASVGTFNATNGSSISINSFHNGAGTTLPIRLAIDGATFVELTTSGTFVTLAARAMQAYTYNVPVTGFSIVIADNRELLILEPAGTLATGTITMPANPIDGQRVGFSTTQAITALTVSPNVGQSIMNPQTSLGAGGLGAFIYRAANTTWYRAH